MIEQTQLNEVSKDAVIATKIVNKLFLHINFCINADLSKTKLNPLEKTAIKMMLNDKTQKGINDYIMNMYPAAVRNLMDDMRIIIKE